MTTVLVLNAGSSSVRMSLVEVLSEHVEMRAQQHCEGHLPERAEGLERFLCSHADTRPAVVAHRLVHGGTRFDGPTLIDPSVARSLRELESLAPLHMPEALAWIQAATEVLPNSVRQVCAFDSTFFAELPQVAYTYAIPAELARRHGLRRLGFHGFAHRSLWRRWSELRTDLPQGGRLLTLQLGSGCSAAAIRAGAPVDTSMGFSPLEGLIMATRSGDLDPGLLLHLQRSERLSVDQLERLLDRGSGLRGLSSSSGDMRRLLASPDDPDCRLAVECFCYRVRKYVGAYVAVLGGLDGIVFGGGIGENSPEVRSASLAGLESLGISVDAGSNLAAVGREGRISSASMRIEIRVLEVDEAGELARDAVALLGSLEASGRQGRAR